MQQKEWEPGQGWHPGLVMPGSEPFNRKFLERLSKIDLKEKYNARKKQYTDDLGTPVHHSISGPYAKIADSIITGRAAAAALSDTTCDLFTGVCSDARNKFIDWLYSPNAQQREEIERAQEQEILDFKNKTNEYMELRERIKKHDEDQVRRLNINNKDEKERLLRQYADARDKEYPVSYEEYLTKKELEKKNKDRGGKSKKRRNNKVSKRRRRKSNRLRRKSIRRTRK
jgi:hypothetical protein